MARRNKKKRVEGVGFPVPVAGLFIAVAIFGLGYVWLCCQCEALGRDLKGLEVEQSELNKQRLNEEYRWTRLKAPKSIEAALSRHNIKMGWPQRDQLVRISRDPVIQDQLARKASNMPGAAPHGRTVMNE